MLRKILVDKEYEEGVWIYFCSIGRGECSCIVLVSPH